MREILGLIQPKALAIPRLMQPKALANPLTTWSRVDLANTQEAHLKRLLVSARLERYMHAAVKWWGWSGVLALL